MGKRLLLYQPIDLVTPGSSQASASFIVRVSALSMDDFPTLDIPMNATSGRSARGKTPKGWPAGWDDARWRRKPLWTATAMRPRVLSDPSSRESIPPLWIGSEPEKA